MINRYALPFTLLCILAICSCRKGDIGPTNNCIYSADPAYANYPRAAEFQQIIDTYIDRGLPGISVYIQDSSGAWAGSGGMADIEENIPFQPCTVSKVASITKMIVGTLTMLLVEDGLIQLDDIVDPYLSSEVLSKVENAVVPQ